MKFTVARKMTLGFGLVIAMMIISIAAMTVSLQVVKNNVRHVKEESLPFAATAAEMKLATIQVQQWLTDVSATHNPAGYEDAEAAAEQFRAGLAAFRRMFQEENDTAMLDEMDRLETAFNELYKTGDEMAQAYMNRGIEAGNVIMEDFDARSAALADRIDPLYQAQQKEAADMATAIRNSVVRCINIQYALLAAALVVAVVAAWLITRNLLRQLGAEPDQVAHVARKIAEGDLTVSINGQNLTGVYAAMKEMRDELEKNFEQIKSEKALAEKQTQKAEQAVHEADKARQRAENAKREGMLEAAKRLQQVVERVTSASSELSAQVEQVNTGADQQKQRASETATAMEEMNATVLEVAKNAGAASEHAETAVNKAREGADIVGRAVDAINRVSELAGEVKDNMGELGGQVEAIGKIMNVITDIADQTNLLALNAAIEAARAGDAGRGFAVVADEVRKLAEKTMSATKEVEQAINDIQNGTEKNIKSVDAASEAVGTATGLAQNSGQALEEIVNLVSQNTDMVRSIATAAEEQSAASEEINRAVEDINRISGETAHGMNQANQALTDLAELSQELKNIIEKMQSEDIRTHAGKTPSPEEELEEHAELE